MGHICFGMLVSALRCASVHWATTRGHMEERKKEMPDVHQPDLSGAGELHDPSAWCKKAKEKLLSMPQTMQITSSEANNRTGNLNKRLLHTQTSLLSTPGSRSGRMLWQMMELNINACQIFSFGKCDLPQYRSGNLIICNFPLLAQRRKLCFIGCGFSTAG